MEAFGIMGFFCAWCSWENYYVGKTTQRIWCPKRKSGIWEKINMHLDSRYEYG